MIKQLFTILISVLLLSGCREDSNKIKTKAPENKPSVKTEIIPETKTNTAAEILAKKQVPILCYHHIKELRPNDGPMTKTYTVTPGAFAAQMKALSDNGYHSILPDQLYDYLLHNKPLPPNPVMITFDDTREEQFTIGAVEMEKYGFKGAFFLMTVSINRPNYMSKDQIKKLSEKGHTVAAHTWNHSMVTKYAGDDWNIQFVKPKAKIESITGKPLTDFAYPFGLWNAAAIPELKKSGYKMAFILATKRDSLDPIYTIRRIIVPSGWSADRMLKAMNSSFE